VTTRSYHLSRFPVTNGQYAAYVQECGGPVPYRPDGLSAPFSWDPVTRRPPAGTDDHPVVLVSWHDASGFCRWLGGRLPTEPEWEHAARSNEDREWPWGDEWDPGRCNTVEGGRGRILPVGSFSPAGDSGFGIADMSGNVWEWCQSAFAPYPYRHGDDRDRAGALGPRVLRGGAFGEGRYRARCAARNCTGADDAGFTIGFRVALPLDSPSLLPREP
jgi:formylglycine-generating enzyme required for sulfatase activity